MGNVRDVAIIVLAVESIIIGGLLIFLIIQLQRLIRMLREEIKPVIDSTNETVSTVRGTTTFVSEHLVSPIIEATSFMAGFKRVTQVLTGWPKGNGAGQSSSQTEADASAQSAGSIDVEPDATQKKDSVN